MSLFFLSKIPMSLLCLGFLQWKNPWTQLANCAFGGPVISQIQSSYPTQAKFSDHVITWLHCYLIFYIHTFKHTPLYLPKKKTYSPFFWFLSFCTHLRRLIPSRITQKPGMEFPITCFKDPNHLSLRPHQFGMHPLDFWRLFYLLISAIVRVN